MDLFALLAKAKTLFEAVKAGNLRVAADLAGDFLKLVSQFLPTGTPVVSVPGGGVLQPFTMPDSSDLLTLLTLLMRMFGKK